jgi:hypothetical protein
MDVHDCSDKRIDIIDDVIISGSNDCQSHKQAVPARAAMKSWIHITVLAINAIHLPHEFRYALKKDNYMKLEKRKCNRAVKQYSRNP